MPIRYISKRNIMHQHNCILLFKMLNNYILFFAKRLHYVSQRDVATHSVFCSVDDSVSYTLYGINGILIKTPLAARGNRQCKNCVGCPETTSKLRGICGSKNGWDILTLQYSTSTVHR
jgi:hypothetical protein